MKSRASDRAGSDARGADGPSAASAPSGVTKRRGLLLGVGAAGAALVAAKALPGAPAQVAAATPAKPAPDTSGGYQESQHVLRYYETTRI